LHLAINKKAGLMTFHSPNPLWGLGCEEGMDPMAERYWWRALLKSEYEEAKAPDPESVGWTFDLDTATTPAVTVSGGKGRGRLIGGNLSLVAALSGTPYEMETEGRIVFLEDVGEAPY